LNALCGQQANFASGQGGSASETEGMRKLRSIGADLGRNGAVKELLTALQDQGPNSISTFEFLSSGAVRQLRSYLQGGTLLLLSINALLLCPGQSCLPAQNTDLLVSGLTSAWCRCLL